jgi:hypothetical protein
LQWQIHLYYDTATIMAVKVLEQFREIRLEVTSTKPHYVFTLRGFLTSPLTGLDSV